MLAWTLSKVDLVMTNFTAETTLTLSMETIPEAFFLEMIKFTAGLELIPSLEDLAMM